MEQDNRINTQEYISEPDIKKISLKYDFKDKLAIVFRLSALGDVILLSGVLRFWHENFGLRFIVISRSAFLPLFRYNPAVFEVYPLEERDLDKYAFKEKCRELAKRYEDYPLLDLHGNFRARIIAKAWKNKVYHYDKFGLLRRLFLWSKGNLGSATLLEKNVCQRYAEVLCSQQISKERLKPQVYLIPTELRQAQDKLAKLFWEEFSPEFWKDLKPEVFKLWQEKHQKTDNLLQKKIIAIHPFATYEHKTLKPEKWLKLAKNIHKEFGLTHEILWIGKGYNFVSEFGIGKSLINQTPLRELAGLLSHCEILISGDSGPMHLANAVNCKILGIFGPSSEEWGFFPIGQRTKILQLEMPCRPCSLHGSSCSNENKCLTELKEESIISALGQMLSLNDNACQDGDNQK